MAVDLSGQFNMVYPQMFPLGDGPSGESQQEDDEEQQQQGRNPDDSVLQRSELLRRMQQQQQQQQSSLGASSSPGGAMMHPTSMLAPGMNPAIIDAHQQRTQSILNAAIAAANQASDARSLHQASLSAGAGMGFASAGMPYPRGYGGYGQNLSQQEAQMLQNRYSMGAAATSLPPASWMPSSTPLAPVEPMGQKHKTQVAGKKRKAAAASKKPSKKRTKSFPERLMQAITDAPNDNAVAWLPDGKSFVVVEPDEFVETVLKTSFKGCKYSSFVRKLHRWGFVRLTSGTGTDCFHHPLFQKDRNDLCLMITCTPRDGKEMERGGHAATVAMREKPPSLAGVEKFIRTRKAPPPESEEGNASDK